jgi:hypothetical protein
MIHGIVAASGGEPDSRPTVKGDLTYIGDEIEYRGLNEVRIGTRPNW